MLKKIISVPADFMVYTLLGAKQRKKIGDLLTRRQKEKLTRLLNGRKFEQRQMLKAMKHHLYNLGFTYQALADMEAFLNNTDHMETRRLISWEMSLWHANKNTREGAEEALKYLPGAADGEKNLNQQRRIAILTAECLERQGERAQAQAQVLIDKQIARAPRADLYLAAANLKTSIEARIDSINKALNLYDLAPIGFDTDINTAAYDNLITLPADMQRKVGPKVSVILPAYNAEDGIRIAIESMLSQSWLNIELLVVDDCSSDNTAGTIAEYAKKDSRVKHLSTPVNGGPYVARNIALKAATGEFVTINDADDWSHKQKIEIQATHLIENGKVMANTSEHARLTEEDLKLYRRGIPGKYIFPNMSSIMFRRQPVIENIGFWDSVRFAADGEFKRRLIKVFGQKSYVDLATGPLSLPRQSVSSLTGSSAFGYDGFFMGVRKEYVEALEHHHAHAPALYYPQNARPFPVPEPMWPQREEKIDGRRQFDAVIASDFRQEVSKAVEKISTMKKENSRIGLMQLYVYDLTLESDIHPEIRQLIDGDHVQMIVYGEKITAQILTLSDPRLLETWQKYRPEITAGEVSVEVPVTPEPQKMQPIQKHMKEYFGTAGTWYPHTDEIREMLEGWDVPLTETTGDDVDG
ncbi:glycosyltransferase family 2 protein [Salinicoccus albus]|uniref:glycosyltransferase family 2 protein n=1 Tax=Salinicoccus albus TaxID=418756 RepID=UPI00037E2D82|nr:glycosyltransferase family 2 protein [Salinicoccus albus]